VILIYVVLIIAAAALLLVFAFAADATNSLCDHQRTVFRGGVLRLRRSSFADKAGDRWHQPFQIHGQSRRKAAHLRKGRLFHLRSSPAITMMPSVRTRLPTGLLL
jgi:hypothetical protein